MIEDLATQGGLVMKYKRKKQKRRKKKEAEPIVGTCSISHQKEIIRYHMKPLGFLAMEDFIYFIFSNLSTSRRAERK